MSLRLFKSFVNGQTRRFEPTADDLASELALEMIDRIKERRAAAHAKELACEPSEPWLDADKEAYDTLETLMKGRHRAAVVKLLFEHFPELVAQMKVN